MIRAKKPYLLWVATLLLLAPWFVIQMNTGVNGDTIWLLTGAQRILHGASFVQEVFETNPPLNIIIHIPVVLLSNMTGLPVYYATYLCVLLLIALSFMASRQVLQRFDFVPAERRACILIGFLTGATIIASISFAERDHLIFIGLFPLVLAQYARTRRIPLPAFLEWSVFALGSVAVLLKPHYGVVPAALILHRAVVQRRFFSTIKDPDVLTLTGMTVIYAAGVYLFAPDFIYEILPHILKLYVSMRNPEIVIPVFLAHTVLIGFFLALESFLSSVKGPEKELSILLYTSALLCLIPYALQMKGYEYHLIPALGFFYVALAQTIHACGASYIRKDLVRMSVTLALLFGVAYTHKPLLPHYPTHKTYRELPLAQAIEKNCPSPCVVFVFHNNMEILWQSILYTNAVQASRFPSFWFLPSIYLKKNMSDEEDKGFKQDFAKMIAEDFNHFHPSTLILASNLHPQNGETFNFVNYFSENPDFKKAIAPYKKVDTLQLNQRDYFRGTTQDYDEILTYDIYRRD